MYVHVSVSVKGAEARRCIPYRTTYKWPISTPVKHPIDILYTRALYTPTLYTTPLYTPALYTPALYTPALTRQASTFFAGLAAQLAIGGTFVVTTVDANVLLQHLMRQQGGGRGGRGGRGGGGGGGGDGVSANRVALKDRKGRTLCSVEFDDDSVQRLLRPGGEERDGRDGRDGRDRGEEGEDDGFGLRYQFTLSDNVTEDGVTIDAVGAPEWLVPRETLRNVAGDHGLKLVHCENFHEYVDRKMQEPACKVRRETREENRRTGAYTDTLCVYIVVWCVRVCVSSPMHSH